jgi:hypothetical protein
MNETCVRFGADGHLAGIVTEPETRARLGVVLVTAGLAPKAGPFRLYAELARQLAADGVATLRFDLGGIGESGSGHAGLPLRARTELEIRAAVDHLLERRELDAVVLGGLCSGAEDSLRSAAADPRVTGVLMVDPFAYRVASFGWRHTLHRAVRRTLREIGVYAPLTPAHEGRPRAVKYHYMEHAESSALLGQLIARGTRVHFVYTAGMREVFNHESQLAAAFPELDFGDCVTLDYLRQLDHTQLLADDRRTLVEALARRLRAWGAVHATS